MIITPEAYRVRPFSYSLGVVVVGSGAGDKEQRCVGGSALGPAGDDPQRVGIVHELGLVELRCSPRPDLALGALPDGHHAVQRLQLGVGLILGLVVVTGVLRLRLLAGFLAEHRDGKADVVAVLLGQGLPACIPQDTRW